MAAMHGKAGTGEFTNLTFEMTSWSVEATADVAESTVMAETWKSYIAGYTDWTASCECVLPKGGSGIVTALGSTATLKFDSVTGLAYSGAAFCTGGTHTGEKDGICTCTLTFQGSSTLGEAT